jgi:O-antigen/teichoic acid export membrane protein
VRKGLSVTAGFAVGMVVLAIVSVAAIPVMISTAGTGGWATIAVGQTVGAIGAVVITYGWNYAGPAVVARGDRQVRRTEYLESLTVRGLLVLPVTAAAAAIAAALSPGSAFLGAWSSLTMVFIGLSASWYFVGTQQPWHLLALETAPRAASTLVAMAAMLSGAGITVGLGIQTAGVLLAFGLCTAHVLRATRGGEVTTRPARHLLALHRHGVQAAVLIALYLALPIVIIRFFVPVRDLAAFAVLDRVQRQVYVGATPLAKALQGWVPGGPAEQLRRRAGTALRVGALIGLAMTAGFALLGHAFVSYLGGDDVDVPLAATLVMAAFVGLSFVDSVLGQAVLAPLGRLDRVARITLGGSVVGLAAVALLAWQLGMVAGIVGMLLGLVVRVVWLVVTFVRTPAPVPQG